MDQPIDNLASHGCKEGFRAQPDSEFNDVGHSLSPRKVARTKKNIHPCRYSNRAMLSNGDLLVKGKTWTGFANSEEQFAENWVGQRIQPFWIEEEARKIDGTNFVVNSMFKAFAVREGNLITGQQQFSGAAAAELVVQTLGR